MAAGMTFTDLVTYVRDLTGVHYSDIITDTLIGRFVNEAYAEICGAENWPYMERIDYLNLPANSRLVGTEVGVNKIQQVIVVRNGDNPVQVKAQPVHSTLQLSERITTLHVNTPIVYDVQEQAIELFPAFDHDVVVEVRYQSVVPTLTGTLQPAFKGEYHNMLAYRAAQKVLIMEADQSDRAQVYANEYTAYYDRMVADYLRSHDEGHFEVTVNG